MLNDVTGISLTKKYFSKKRKSLHGRVKKVKSKSDIPNQFTKTKEK